MEKKRISEQILRLETPCYVFDTDILSERIRLIRSYLSKKTVCTENNSKPKASKKTVDIVYAMKANPMLTAEIEEYVDGFEVCSPGEFRICERHNIPAKKIILSGVCKEEEDLRHVIETFAPKEEENAKDFSGGINSGNINSVKDFPIKITVESQGQFSLLEKLAKEYNIRLNLILRLTSGNQFGINASDIKEILAKISGQKKNNSHLDLSDKTDSGKVRVTGLQFYGGTQKKKSDVITKELCTIEKFLKDVKTGFGFEFELLEYGPGLGVNYFEKDKNLKEEDLLGELAGGLNNMDFEGHVSLELGRFAVASCGRYITKIVDIKENCGVVYVLTDGGIHHINYYGQTLAMQIPFYDHVCAKTGSVKSGVHSLSESDENKKFTVCGSLCTTADVLVKNIPLNNPQIGDRIIFYNVGAYSMTEARALFLSRDFPCVYFKDERGGLRLNRIRRGSDAING